jgi:signal transduction histidine kinase
VREKLFNPFFTAKPGGEGTGLGLSIRHDIIVKQHGGSLGGIGRPGSVAFGATGPDTIQPGHLFWEKASAICRIV